MIKIETKQLQEGAILAQPVITPLGQPLAPAGSAVTRQLINRMKLYRVEYAEIEGEEPAPQEEAPKPVKEAKTYAQESKTHSQKVAGSSEFRTFQIEYVQAIELMKQMYTAAIKDNKPIDSQKICRYIIFHFVIYALDQNIGRLPLYGYKNKRKRKINGSLIISSVLLYKCLVTSSLPLFICNFLLI